MPASEILGLLLAELGALRGQPTRSVKRIVAVPAANWRKSELRHGVAATEAGDFDNLFVVARK